MRRIALLLLVVAACRGSKPAPGGPPPADAPVRLDAREADATVAIDPLAAVDRAAVWMAGFPPEQLRFDAAIGLSALVRKADSEPARRALAAARAVADRDTDSPLRRAYDDTAPPPPAATWTAPGTGTGGEQVNVNRVIAEALGCDAHPVRASTLAYIGGPMRDVGGYQTAHGLWALVIARDRGCLDAARFETLARPLIDELRAAQPSAPPRAVGGTDLYAERLLMLVMAGEHDVTIDAWATALLHAQDDDGGFGQLAPGDADYFRFHATIAAAWALAEWRTRAR